MKRIIGIAVLMLFLLSLNSYSQKWKLRRYEAMIGFGSANCLGDIGGSVSQNNWFGVRDIDILSSRPLLYLGGRYKFKEDIHFKFTFISGWLSGTDEGSRNDFRNLSYNTFVQEFSVHGEYYFIPEEKKFRSAATFSRRGMINDFAKVSAYVTIGAGGIYYISNLEGDLYLQGPEEYNGYGKFALVIPVGIGMKYIISSKWALNFEIGGRYTTTDYLEGFKSEFSNANDIYYFSSASLVYRIKTDRRGRPILFK